MLRIRKCVYQGVENTIFFRKILRKYLIDDPLDEILPACYLKIFVILVLIRPTF